MAKPLTREELLAAGPLRRVGAQVWLLPDIDSTNTHLLTYAGELPDGTVVWTELQREGRGRHGRRWVAPRGSSVMLSVLLHEPGESRLRTGAALLAALAVCDALDRTTDVRARVRWPNDVMVDGKKLGGVLAESKALTPQRRAVVIGIGINCLQQAGHFPESLRTAATSLELASSQPISRARVAAALLQALDTRVAEAGSEAGWRMVEDAWRERCDDFGSRVTLQQDGQQLAGTVLDITVEGDLLVQLDQGGRRQFGAAVTTRIC